MNLSERMLWQIWEKGQIVPGNDPTSWRKDEYGAWMYRRDYKNASSEYGWEVGRISSEQGKTDDAWNLCPLHWKNAKKKDDLYPDRRVTAQGVHNGILM